MLQPYTLATSSRRALHSSPWFSHFAVCLQFFSIFALIVPFLLTAIFYAVYFESFRHYSRQFRNEKGGKGTMPESLGDRIRMFFA